MNKKLKPTIGLEIHIELKTKSKMFCACSANHFSVKPNTHTCPVCLGLPGALPVPNKKAIDWTIVFGKALGCNINLFSKFDRKHYFYPDLPKGYQISQFDIPFCEKGVVEVGDKKIRITRVHLEEDTGKLQHKKVNGKDVSLVDFNRCGVPLMELVTEPDLESGDEAKEFAKVLRRVARYLGISDCDMEKGSMRLEANVSMGLGFDYKVEVKNLNSFNYLKKAIEYEIERQKKIFKKGGKPIQETRGWNEKKNITVSQRIKETSADYRYFPEPDIPPIHFSKSYVEKLVKGSPKLPEFYEEKLIGLEVAQQFIDVVLEDKGLCEYCISEASYAKSKNIKPSSVIDFIIHSKINPRKVKKGEVVEKLIKRADDVISNEVELEDLVKKAIKQNNNAVEDYRSGKEKALFSIMGTVMALTKGKANPKKTLELLKKILS